MNIRNRYKELGLKWWKEVGDANTDDDGFKLRDTFFGASRPYYDGVLYGSTTFCLMYGEKVSSYPLTDDCLPQGTELWVVKIPPTIYNEARKHVNATQFMCLAVNKEDSFPTHNWNAIPIDKPADAKKHLAGWTA